MSVSDSEIVHTRLVWGSGPQWTLYADGTYGDVRVNNQRETLSDSGAIALLDALDCRANTADIQSALEGWTADTVAAREDQRLVFSSEPRPVIWQHTGQGDQLRRTVTIATWRIVRPGRDDTLVYLVHESIRLDSWTADERVPAVHATVSRAEADEVAASWAADRRAAVSLAEAAETLGMTSAALRQARRRAILAWQTDKTRPTASQITNTYVQPPLYRLRDLQAMLAAAPGHGPGRGHAS